MAVSLRQGDTLRVGNTRITYSSTDDRGRVVLHVECPPETPLAVSRPVGRLHVFSMTTDIRSSTSESY